MVPSENLRNVFVEFAHANNLFDRKSEMAKLNEKTAYALATYEIRTENQTPRDKGELQVMVKDKNARVLMQEICWFCQKPLDYDKWIQGSKDDEFGIAYAVPFTRTWMPFFIVKRSVVPDYDERFNLYGYDRLVHMCELHKREFSFQVLNQAFMVSRGFRAKSSLSADERRVRDDWQEFKDNFSSALTKFGYTDEAYQQC